jgi:hypothetical protein
MTHPANGFWRTGFLALLVLCAFLLGRRSPGTDPALAEGESFPAGGRSAGGGTADGDRNMIAVTGTSASGAAVLYLVDTRLKRLAVYQASGKNIELVAARNIEYDLKLDSYRDTSEDEVQVRKLRSDWLKGQPGKDAGGKEEVGPGK